MPIIPIIKDNKAELKDYLLVHAISKAETGENEANNKVAYSKKSLNSIDILRLIVNNLEALSQEFERAIEEYNKLESVENKRECRIILNDIF